MLTVVKMERRLCFAGTRMPDQIRQGKRLRASTIFVEICHQEQLELLGSGEAKANSIESFEELPPNGQKIK